MAEMAEKRMKLSEAILAGAALHGPTKSGWIAHGPGGEPKTCSITAAMEAFGLLKFEGTESIFTECTSEDHGTDRLTGQDFSGEFMRPPEWFLKMTDVVAAYPCGCRQGVWALWYIIPHLHDIHRWSREATALWVETVEKADEKKRESAKSIPAPAPVPVYTEAERVRPA